MSKVFFIILLFQLAAATGFSQNTHKGLTPGKSTRADVERVLGRPLKSVSKTLVEYKSPGEGARLYVQYQDESPAAVVERIELTCFDNDEVHDKCGPVLNAIGQLDGVLEDASASTSKQEGRTVIRYFGAPRFMVWRLSGKGVNAEQRLAYYSQQLYESAVPKGGCTGTIFGTWQTERARVTIVRAGDNGIEGAYAKHNGSFSLKKNEGGGYFGEWKDDTGSGTIALLLDNNSFSASLSRGAAASVPPKQPPARSAVGAELDAMTDALKKQRSGVEVGTIIEPSGPSLSRITGLPPGERLTGKCLP